MKYKDGQDNSLAISPKAYAKPSISKAESAVSEILAVSLPCRIKI